MKKLIASLLMIALMAIALPLTADAQRRCYTRKRSNVSRTYRNRSYRTQGYTYKRPSFYRRHRNLINLGLATGGGALLGGLIGGNRKGIGIGALVGAGSGALYTYVLRPKKRRY